jgi:hypothetical protein
MEIAGGILQVIGLLTALANGVWLWARLVYPRDMTRLEATSIFLPTLLIGLCLFYVGHRLCVIRQSRKTTK